MFAPLGQFVVKVANLAEAEGRLAIGHLQRLGLLGVLISAAGMLVIGAVAVLAAAVYVALHKCVHPAVALLASALVLLAAAASIAYAARSLWLTHTFPCKRRPRDGP
jgi:hypothetical protein